MATQFPPAPAILMANPHEIALPYRGDGVACALRQTYQTDDGHIPTDMLLLLTAIDEPLVTSGPG